MKRRQALARIGAMSLLSSGSLAMPGIPDCSSGTPPSPDEPLAIDVHCHVCNASDLQVKDFIEEVVAFEKHLDPRLANILARLATTLAWMAPRAKDEAVLFDRPGSQPDAPLAQVESLRSDLKRTADAQERRVRDAIDRTLRTDPRLRELARDYAHPRRINADGCRSPATPRDLAPAFTDLAHSDFRTAADVTSFFALAGPAQIKELLVSMLRHRYKNCFSIFDAYSCVGGAVDMYCPALLDYDFWLGGGAATKSPLADQYIVMERVMRLMQGRFHAYAPFNPWRQAVDRSGHYFRDMQDAVEKRGFIGIKLYPSIGFAPYGNVDALQAHEAPPSWRRAGFPGVEALDRAMDTLFAWCNARGVPILAHAGPSFGPDGASDALGGPTYWRKAIDRMQSIAQSRGTTPAPVCFGHSGGAYLECDHKPAWPVDFARLMHDFPNAYGDLSYWDDFIGASPERYDNAVGTLKAMHAEWSGIDQRLMYGSDWNLLLQEKDWAQYLNRFAPAIRTGGFDDVGLRRILGPNAAAFLGLAQSSGPNSNRPRLDALYGRWQVAPAWRSKVDRIG